jgi:isoamylase
MMIALRKKYFALTREQFCNRVSWHGVKIGDPDWSGVSRTLAFQVHGWHSRTDLYVMFNAHWEQKKFLLPPHGGQWRWRRLVDTNLLAPEDLVEEKDAIQLKPADHYTCFPRSTVILISNL